MSGTQPPLALLNSNKLDQEFLKYLEEYSSISEDQAIVNAISISRLNAEQCAQSMKLILKMSDISQSTEYEIADLMSKVEAIRSQCRAILRGTNLGTGTYSALLFSKNLLIDTVALLARVHLLENKSNEFKLFPGGLDLCLQKNKSISRDFGLYEEMSTNLLKESSLAS